MVSARDVPDHWYGDAPDAFDHESERGGPVTGRTPGHAAYEAMHASREQRDHDGGHIPWEQLDEFMSGDFGALKREDMEAAAQAVLNDAFPGLRRQLDQAMHRVRQLTNGILGVAEQLEQSAAATAPSKKSEIQNETAGKLRVLLDVTDERQAAP